MCPGTEERCYIAERYRETEELNGLNGLVAGLRAELLKNKKEKKK